jgi:hypothetical protein
MVMHGQKTKIGCIIIFLAAIINYFIPLIGQSLFMAGVALAFYGSCGGTGLTTSPGNESRSQC